MEIERKFIAGEILFDLTNFKCLNIEQSYISTNPTIRLRKSNENFILTVKGSGGICREEFELNITEKQYLHLLNKIETPILTKKRYLVPIENNLTAEIDVYSGNLDGLKTIEVEFKSLEFAESFVPPYWFGKDVSLDARYKNTKLSQYGIPKL